MCALRQKGGSVIAEVDAIIDKYLSQQHTICLAVVPANVDVATVDILERAKRYDPEGDRTIGVITKADLVDQGAEGEILSTVNNVKKPLKLGYVLVKNRGQAALNEGISLKQAKVEENVFFAKHPVYSQLMESLRGVDSLVLKLSDILVHRITVLIPEMLSNTETQLGESKQHLEAEGPKPPESEGDISAALMKLLTSFETVLKESLTGTYTNDLLSDPANASLRIRALAVLAFDDFQKKVNVTRPAFGSEAYVQTLMGMIASSRGEELPGFLNPKVFNQMVACYINEWKPLGVHLINFMVLECVSIAKQLIKRTCGTYVNFVGIVSDVVESVAETLNLKLMDAFHDCMEQELTAPYTQNHYFMDTYNKLRLASMKKILLEKLTSVLHHSDTGSFVTSLSPDTMANSVSSWLIAGVGNQSNAEQEAEMLGHFLDSYWKVASKRFCDEVPKIITTTCCTRSATRCAKRHFSRALSKVTRCLM